MTLENQALHLQITELEAQLAERTAEVERVRSELQSACKVIDDRGICERDASAPLPERLDAIIVNLRSDRHYAEMDSVNLRAELAEARAEVERATAACQRLGDEVTRVTGEAVKYATDIVILKNAMKSARISMLWSVGHLSRLGLETEAELVQRDAKRLAEAAGLDQPGEANHA